MYWVKKAFCSQERLGDHVSSSFKRNSALFFLIYFHWHLRIVDDNMEEINVFIDKMPFYRVVFFFFDAL